MRKLIAIGTTAALLLPGLSLAAATDVTLTTSVSLLVNGITINITGSSAVVESISAGASTFSFTLADGSSIEMTAPSRNVLTPSSLTYSTTEICTSAQSKLAYTATGALTVTITPSGSLCNTPASGGGGSSSSYGGGGGGGTTTTTTTTTATTTAATTTPVTATTTTQTTTTSTNPTVASLQAQLGALLAQLQALKGGAGMTTSATFSRNLQVGSTGADVKALQVYLNTHGYAVASSGPGSSGNETTRFGPATKAALVKLQKAAGITPAAGYFGALTRAYVNAHP